MSNTIDSIASSYDAVPYKSEPIPCTNPAHLAVLAKLYGLSPTSPSQCTILEIGCSTGTNILSLASAYPESRCIGIDISERQIQMGKTLLNKVSIPNVDLRCLNIMDLEPSFGSFDFIIVHGILSWVPQEVRKKIFQVMQTQLNDHGLGYISYNCFPGWSTRSLIREMMIYEGLHVDSNSDKIANARNAVDFLLKTLPQNTPYGNLLRHELMHIPRMPDWYIAHDFLAEVNTPFYFADVAAIADIHGLQYIADAETQKNLPQDLSREAQLALKQHCSDRIQLEQYADMLRNRMFRRSIFSKKEHRLNSNANVEVLRSCYLATQLKRTSPAQAEAGVVQYAHPNGGGLRSPDTRLSEIVSILSACWPGSMHFDELIEKLSPRPNAAEVTQITHSLMTCFLADLLELSVTPRPFTLAIETKPRASALSRAQSHFGKTVTSLLHQQVDLSDHALSLLPHLTGEKTTTELQAQFQEPEKFDAALSEITQQALIIYNR